MREAAKIPRQQGGAAKPCRRRNYASDAKPLPACFAPAWCKAVNEGKANDDDHKQNRPASISKKQCPGRNAEPRTEGGDTTPAASTSSSMAMEARVKASETRLSLMKPRFSFSS